MAHRTTQISTLLLSLGLSGALLVACGGSQAPADSAAAEDAPAGEASTEEAPSEDEEMVEFDEMSAPEKMAHMKKVVAPGMAKVFQEADAEEYADFSCVNCHGPGAKQGNFEMPSDALPKLNMAEIDFTQGVAKFMAERVVPEMAHFLGEEPYNPETQEGFGCMGCHQAAE